MAQREVKRTYWWGDAKDTQYESEAALKAAHEEACDVDKHDWGTTFVFGIYHCRKCSARYEVSSS